MNVPPKEFKDTIGLKNLTMGQLRLLCENNQVKPSKDKEAMIQRIKKAMESKKGRLNSMINFESSHSHIIFRFGGTIPRVFIRISRSRIKIFIGEMDEPSLQ